MKPNKEEEKLIAFLSKVAEKSSLYLGCDLLVTAFLVCGSYGALAGFLIGVLDIYFTDLPFDLSKLLFGVGSCAVLNIVLMFVGVALWSSLRSILFGDIGVVANSYKIPNPNKYTPWLKVCRMSSICLAIVSVFFAYGSGYSMAVLFILLGVPIGFYTLCADQPPPQPKLSLSY